MKKMVLILITSGILLIPHLNGSVCALEIYYTDPYQNTILHNGSVLISGRHSPQGISVYENKLYWTEHTPDFHGIYSADLSGENIELVADRYYPVDVEASGGFLYWTERGDSSHGGALVRSNLDGSDIEVLYDYPYDGLALPDGLEIFGDWAYVLSDDSGLLERYRINGAPAHEVVRGGLSGRGDIAFSDEPRMYYTDWYFDSIWSSTPTGEDALSIITGMGDRWGVAVADGYLYWAESKNDANPGIYRSRLDGSDIEIVYAGGSPYGLDVLGDVPIPEPSTILILGCGLVALHRHQRRRRRC